MEMTAQQKGVLEQLELMIKAGNDLNSALVKLQVMGISSELLDEVAAIRQRIIDERFSLSVRKSISERDGTSSGWYAGPSESDTFWPALKAELEKDPSWAPAVPSLDETSTDVVGLLADPHSPRISTRGLVLGYVQSGKTANFTATIAKAADAGYRLFVVLSGVHNALRRQTQIRLESQLRELSPTKWLELTDEQRDFGNPVKALPLVAGTDLRLLAVVKKNVSRLTRLRDWLMQAHEHGGLDNCPVLIIDDEADQASPNSAQNADLDRTKVNERISELLGLPRVAYVGYTATPFANVLINPTDVKDLYPRSFIYSLPKPPIYFGAEELFGIGVAEEDEHVGHDMIRTVPGASDGNAKLDEASMYRLPAKGEPFVPVVTDSLDDAIRWFLLATAARRVRDGRARHSSMLIHTTQRVDPQLAYIPVIRDHISQLREAWNDGESRRWSELWSTEQARERPEHHGFEALDFDELAEHLTGALRDVKVLADNSRSTERLIYTDEPATVVAIGGNTLSRGLTLEGLVSSYFLRTASTYDSLLQMGRWFGYRVGYSDLPRIWTTKDLEEDFRFLSEVESDIRADIARYASEDATPLDLPVRIRLHPRMKVAAKNKMQFAEHATSSFGGQRPQTTYFHHRDPEEIEGNLGAARTLLTRAQAEAENTETLPSRIVLKRVPVQAVLEFVDTYRFHERSELRGSALASYIGRQLDHGALHDWNIAVITRQSPAATVDIGLGEVNLITRSKLERTSDDTTANIGALMSPPDRVADLIDATEAMEMSDIQLAELRNASGRPLLLIYPIDKDSEPKDSGGRRVPLGASGHLVGVAFSFPGAVPNSEPDDLDKIAVDPQLLEYARSSADDGGEYEDAEGSRDEVVLENE